MTTTIKRVDCKYGAPMGRTGRTMHWPEGSISNEGIKLVPVKLHLKRVHIDSGGYDSGGAYWGVGLPLYEAFCDETGFCTYLRARTRDGAKAELLGQYPTARFYR